MLNRKAAHLNEILYISDLFRNRKKKRPASLEKKTCGTLFLYIAG